MSPVQSSELHIACGEPDLNKSFKSTESYQETNGYSRGLEPLNLGLELQRHIECNEFFENQSPVNFNNEISPVRSHESYKQNKSLV